ncbi:MAG: helix-turn-helix domain-containing protein [Bacteroidales bacterium]
MNTPIDLFSVVKELCELQSERHWIYIDIHSDCLTIPHHIRCNSVALLLCSSGYMDIEIDFRIYRLTSNWSINLMREHIVQIKEISADFSGVCLIMDQQQWRESRREVEQLAPLYSQVKAHPFVPIKNEYKELLLNYLNIFKFKYSNNDSPYNAIVERKLISVLFYEIDRIYANIRSQLPAPDKKDKVMMEFLNMVSTHFRKERRVEFYATHFHLTSKYLSTIIAQRSHQSAAQWIDTYVVTEAKILLRTTTKSIKEIAEELNFSDQSFFGKYFLLHTGVRPREYRK